MKKIILVAGARPNFMKIAPLMHALKNNSQLQPILVHTGQHYDVKMSGQFFEELHIPSPDINLEVGSASHAVQVARIMENFEQVCLDEKPDYVLVVGDVNSTAACCLVAAKLNIKTIHYEAGLRSRDRTMPEEINRLVTDSITDIFLTTSKDADENLLQEGVNKSKIHMVGNLMIDTLVAFKEEAKEKPLEFKLLNKEQTIRLGKDFYANQYAALTFHRPSNVDAADNLKKLVGIWGEMSAKLPVIFPIHPRTYKNLQEFNLLDEISQYDNLYLIEPQGYLSFINLVQHAKFVLTDSGGIQEETTYLNIPCLTVRPNTERPVTIWEGSNKLININEIEAEVLSIIDNKGKQGNRPNLWDGHSANRIVEILTSL